jgi:plastocyanin
MQRPESGTWKESNMRREMNWVLGAVVVGLAACGSDTAGTGGSTCTLGTAATVTISSAGVSPKMACVIPASTVTFTNTDTVPHTLAPDAATGCALLNVGPIAAGQSAPVTFPAVLTCTYHDVASPSNTAFHGTVSVATPGTPGY